MKKRACLIVAGLLMSALVWAAGGQAQSGASGGASAAWAPSRNVDWVVTSSAGGGSDIFSRMIADIMVKEKFVEATILVTNDSASIGEPARARVSQIRGAPADHTLMAFNSGDMITMVNNTTRRVADFTPIGIMAIDKQLLYVGKDSKYKTFREIMNAIRAGNRIVAGGSRGDDQTTFQMLLDEMGWSEDQFAYIISQSSNDAITSILGNHIDVVISKPAASAPYVEAGQLIPILALSNERYTGDLASAPTVSEVGPYKNVEFPVWRGIVGPASMSAEAQAFWSAVLKKVSETETWKKDYIDKFKLIPEYMTFQQSTEYMTNFQKEYLASQGK